MPRWWWLGVVACSGGSPKDGQAPDGDTDTDTDSDTDTDTDGIGPEGGSITTDGVTVVFPAGSLTGDTEVTVGVDVTPPTALPSTLDPLSVVVRVDPLGLALALDATLTVPSAPPQVAAEAWYLSDDADPTWERLGPATSTSARSVAGGTATFETPTLGYFAVVEAPPRIDNPCGPALGFAADSPWPSARGCETGRRRTFVVGPTTAPTPTWTWYDPATIQVYGPVIDAAGDLYVTSNQFLARLAPDGTERWKVVVRPAYPTLGTATAPMLLANGLVLVCRYGGETMAAFDPADGGLAWESTVACDHYTPAVPRSDALLLVNNVLVDPDDGSVVLTAPGDTCGNPVLDSADNSYCLDAGGGLRAFDQDLAERWHTDLPAFTVLDPDFMVVEDAGVERITAFDNAFALGRLYPTTGPTLPGDADIPSFSGLPFAESAAGGDSLLFVTRGVSATGGLVRLDFTGSVVTTSTTPQGRALTGHFPSPVVDGDENVYYGTFDGQVAAVNADGSTRWVVSLGATNVRDVVVGPGGAVYAITTDAYGSANRLRALE
jgi:hypothetical protein